MLAQILVTPDFAKKENQEYSTSKIALNKNLNLESSRFFILLLKNENLEYSRFSIFLISGVLQNLQLYFEAMDSRFKILIKEN